MADTAAIDFARALLTRTDLNLPFDHVVIVAHALTATEAYIIVVKKEWHPQEVVYRTDGRDCFFGGYHRDHPAAMADLANRFGNSPIYPYFPDQPIAI